MPQIILASTSRYRRALLERCGIDFTCAKPNLDEETQKRMYLDCKGSTPKGLAEFLAQAKAQSLKNEFPDAYIIGSDQLACIDDKILGKPGNAPTALKQLQLLRGRTHQLHTAVCIISPNNEWRHCDTTNLSMLNLNDDELLRVIDRDAPFDCAGAYKLECSGITLFDHIQSADHSAITGLPLLAVCKYLRNIGANIPAQ